MEIPTAGREAVGGWEQNPDKGLVHSYEEHRTPRRERPSMARPTRSMSRSGRGQRAGGMGTAAKVNRSVIDSRFSAGAAGTTVLRGL